MSNVLIVCLLILLTVNCELSLHPQILKINKRRIQAKSQKLNKFVNELDLSIPAFFKPASWCGPIHKQGPVVFAAGIDKYQGSYRANLFTKSLRNTGYNDDIVLAIDVEYKEGFLKALQNLNAIAFHVNLTCSGHNNCRFVDVQLKESSKWMSVNMLRVFMYKWWASMYHSDAIILLTDFRDVIFQSNPFLYRSDEWSSPRYQLVVFQESFPNKMIYRCMFNSGWIRGCYGEDTLKFVGSNPVSCSGTVMGTGQAIIAYVSIYLYLFTYINLINDIDSFTHSTIICTCTPTCFI